MRHEPRSTDVAIAATLPVSRGTSWVAATRAVIAVAFLRIAFALIWAVVATLKWNSALQLFRL